MLQGKPYRFTISDMKAWETVKSASRKAESWTLALVDALPPYYIIEGTLESKSIDGNGEHILLVDGEPIYVDRATYRILDIGESVRARHTRNARAINIDRHIAPNGH